MLDDIRAERLKKLERYRERFDPYPAAVKRSTTIGAALGQFPELETTKKEFTVAGRLIAWRDQGKIVFGDLEDGTGKLQVVLNDGETDDFDFIRTVVDVGDFLEVGGTALTTKRGERSVAVRHIRIITKSLLPLPVTWYGLDDTETRLRKRYLDAIIRPEVKELFRKKSAFWDTTRALLNAEGFLEVETPILEAVPGGAEAEPFATHLNALDQDLYLRISLELPLKKMLVGGFDRVFEIGRIFRNEGIDKEHLQDYTQMECYAAYWDYEDLMQFVEKLYVTVIGTVFGTLSLPSGGTTIEWKTPWPKVDYCNVFKQETGIDLSTAVADDLKRKAHDLHLDTTKVIGRGRLIDLIYKKAVRPKLIQPCFLIDPPVDVEPLAKRLVKDCNRVARFQVVAAGTELGKGFSELNDPLDQRQRFEMQMRLRAAGDTEAERLDESFLEALEYGMPPAAGFGMSERLFAVLADKPVREAVFFPLMRQEG
jgi:lysyl-tRNA synthetase, class II